MIAATLSTVFTVAATGVGVLLAVFIYVAIRFTHIGGAPVYALLAALSFLALYVGAIT